MKSDSFFYKLFAKYPDSFLQLLGQPECAADYVFDSVEVKERFQVEIKNKAFRIDGIFRPRDPSSRLPTIVTEVQFQKDDLLHRRLFSEISLYLYLHPEVSDWKAAVIWPNRQLANSDTLPFQELFDSGRIQPIYLDELALDNLPLGAAIARLAIEPSREAEERFAQVVRSVRQEIDDSNLQEEIIKLIEEMAIERFPSLSKQEVAQMLGFAKLEDTRVYKEVFAEGKQDNARAVFEKLLQRGFSREEALDISGLDPQALTLDPEEEALNNSTNA
ncbi:Rpn family recombination-promoting nuclease/putative transposase [Synechococcus sp. PCC 7336]|uniref:Rpn family recombination-promoting nuclease/putative transposase n=1 Tax=Synechococcus sp. PCC 7336 TaxID=195250 RepID=UPI000348C60B|nr:Rpn family recombination-promoting nuclease/putative transposase [Synechococcus sp. PCC 7336]